MDEPSSARAGDRRASVFQEYEQEYRKSITKCVSPRLYSCTLVLLTAKTAGGRTGVGDASRNRAELKIWKLNMDEPSSARGNLGASDWLAEEFTLSPASARHLQTESIAGEKETIVRSIGPQLTMSWMTFPLTSVSRMSRPA